MWGRDAAAARVGGRPSDQSEVDIHGQQKLGEFGARLACDLDPGHRKYDPDLCAALPLVLLTPVIQMMRGDGL